MKPSSSTRAGGIAGGDRHRLDISVQENARLVVTTAAAEKIYRALGPDAEIEIKLNVVAGARLSWLPQETILFDRCRLSRRIDVELDGDASLIMAEMVVFGRSAMGEAVETGSFTDRWRVRRDGRLLFAETVKLDGAVAEMLAEPAVAAGGIADRDRAGGAGRRRDDRARSRGQRSNSSAKSGSPPGMALRWRGSARKMAQACATILACVLTALGASLPRIWLN